MADPASELALVRTATGALWPDGVNDPASPAYDAGLAGVVSRTAARLRAPGRPPAPSGADLRRVAACPHRRKPACGCGGFACAAGKGDRDGFVSVYTCVACLAGATP